MTGGEGGEASEKTTAGEMQSRSQKVQCMAMRVYAEQCKREHAEQALPNRTVTIEKTIKTT